MSKAIIVSHAGKGQYTVDVQYETKYLQQLVDQLSRDYTQLLMTDLSKATANKIAEAAKLQDAQDAVDLAIFNWNLDKTDANRKIIEDLALAALKQSYGYRVAIQEYNSILAKLDAIRRRLDTLLSNDQDRKRDALWCVDLADGKKDRKKFLPGDEVGVIEISGQDTLGQCLLPSYEHGWEYTIADDGFLANTNGLTPFEFLYDKVMLPPWQKWKHRYRSGEIIDGNPTDGWTVRLDNLKSSEQAIEVNTVTDGRMLTAIHAKYMNCDDLAFGVKDKVVLDVTITGPGKATVIDATIIGFVEKPRPCLVSGFGYYALETDVTPQEWQHVSDEAGPWLLRHPYATDLTAAAFANSGEPDIRSWIGDDADSDAPVLEFIQNGSAIYLSGKKLADIPTDQSWRILGAALSPKRKFLYAVMTYSSASNKVWLMRYSLALDPSKKDDAKGGIHTVILSGSSYAVASFNGDISVNDDTLLSAMLSADATFTGILSVTPGWEKQEYDLGANASTGHIGGKFSFNASCTLALSMWDFIHGAKRVPQAAPGGGASWSTSTTLYDDFWKEKLEITIEAPDAETLTKANASLTNHGRQGFLTKYLIDKTSYRYGSADVDIVHDVINGLFIRDYCYPLHRITEEVQTYSGNYQIDTGFIGDDEIAANITASGTMESKGDNYSEDTYFIHTISGRLIKSVSIPKFGINLPTYDFQRNDSSTGNSISGSSSAAYSVIRGIVGIIDIDAGLVAYDYTALEYVSTGSCVEGSPTMVSSHTESTEIEHGQLWCGSLLDASIGDPETTVEDTGPSPTTAHCGTGIDTEAWCVHDSYSDSGDAPPLEEPYQFGEFGLSFDHVITEFFIDATGWTGDDALFSNLAPTQAYEHVQGARAASNKYMAYWQNTRTPGSVREYKAFITGGDPFALDTLTDPVIYRAIHPT